LLFLQHPSFALILSQIKAVHIPTVRSIKIQFVLPYFLHQSLADATLLSCFPNKTLYVWLFSPIRDIRPAQTASLTRDFRFPPWSILEDCSSLLSWYICVWHFLQDNRLVDLKNWFWLCALIILQSCSWLRHCAASRNVASKPKSQLRADLCEAQVDFIHTCVWQLRCAL
jgi:hypothetical protein